MGKIISRGFVMNHQTLTQLKRFFLAYADKYIQGSHDPEPLTLKKDHTLRVCSEILALGKALGLDDDKMMLAEAMALFHDLGRFRQYEIYKTFLDQQSENHARLSLQEMDAHGVLDSLTVREATLIKKSIGFHNVAQIPRQGDGDLMFFIRLLRDADKLDIWRVVIENYTHPRPGSQQAINLGLSDDPGVSSDVMDAIMAGTFVKSAAIKCLNDFKLMQISWVFDLNFSPSIQWVKERKYIEKIAACLPDIPRVNAAIAQVYHYMDTRVPLNDFNQIPGDHQELSHAIGNGAGR